MLKYLKTLIKIFLSVSETQGILEVLGYREKGKKWFVNVSRLGSALVRWWVGALSGIFYYLILIGYKFVPSSSDHCSFSSCKLLLQGLFSMET
jgi:hypothetical protein